MIKAILFDKDGTLTDFRATWEPWLARVVPDFAAAADADADDVAAAFGFDLATGRLAADSPYVTAPGQIISQDVASRTGWTVDAVEAWFHPRTADVEQVDVPGVSTLFDDLLRQGYRVGVLTNAAEADARHHLREMGLLDRLDALIGYDSGFGAKPDPAGAADFAARFDLAPDEVVFIGDGDTDIAAGRGAGLHVIGVLTGTMSRSDLAPLCDAILPDVTSLPGWLAARAGADGAT